MESCKKGLTLSINSFRELLTYSTSSKFSGLQLTPPSITTSQNKEDEQLDSLQANLPSGVSWMANDLGYVAD